MQISGTVKNILPSQTFTTKKGSQLTKMMFVIETNDKYPKTIAITVFNDTASVPPIGTLVSVEIDIESREYNGRYYTDIIGRSITTINATVTASPQQSLSSDSKDDSLVF